MQNIQVAIQCKSCLSTNPMTEFLQGPVFQKTINANPRLRKKPRNLFLYFQVLFNADFRQNFTLEEVNLEKQK